MGMSVPSFVIILVGMNFSSHVVFYLHEFDVWFSDEQRHTFNSDLTSSLTLALKESYSIYQLANIDELKKKRSEHGNQDQDSPTEERENACLV